MSKFSNVLAQIDVFCKLALPELDSVIKNNKAAINSEIAGGIKSVNKLFVSNPAAANSAGLQALDNYFGTLSGSISTLVDTNAVPTEAIDSVARMLESSGQVAFYTSKSNSGTGYDPLVYTGDAVSPAAYFNRIQTHLKNLSSYLQRYKAKPSAGPDTGIHNPSVPSGNLS